jgi:hypothetical protein
MKARLTEAAELVAFVENKRRALIDNDLMINEAKASGDNELIDMCTNEQKSIVYQLIRSVTSHHPLLLCYLMLCYVNVTLW